MIQDILPRVYYNEYKNISPGGDSFAIIIEDGKVLLGRDEEGYKFPVCNEVLMKRGKWIYLFAIDNKNFFLLQTKEDIKVTDYEYVDLGSFRQIEPRFVAFAVVTAYQLHRWYGDNKYCGRCGAVLIRDEKERMLKCPKCCKMVYPTIAPAVIIGVTHGNRILLTKYADRDYNRYALVAGFTEIGESLEQTVRREVMEEVGLKVKNIRYYKSQPWPLTGTLLAGFFAELDGDETVTLDESELSEAVWFERGSIPVKDDNISLTREMIEAFSMQALKLT